MNHFSQPLSFSLRQLSLSPLVSSVGAIALGVSVAMPAQATCADQFKFIPEGDLRQVSEPYPKISWGLGNAQADRLQISVTDETFRELYFWDYKLQPNGAENLASAVALMSMQASETLSAQPLAVGESQTWQLTLICDEGDRRQDIVIEQQIERIELPEDLKSNLKDLAPEQRITAYLNQNLVHAALTEFINWQAVQDDQSTSTIYTSWLDFEKKAGIMKEQ